jgi:hypothetical protein
VQQVHVDAIDPEPLEALRARVPDSIRLEARPLRGRGHLRGEQDVFSDIAERRRDRPFVHAVEVRLRRVDPVRPGSERGLDDVAGSGPAGVILELVAAQSDHGDVDARRAGPPRLHGSLRRPDADVSLPWTSP